MNVQVLMTPTSFEVSRNGRKIIGSHPTTTKADGHLIEFYRLRGLWSRRHSTVG